MYRTYLHVDESDSDVSEVFPKAVNAGGAIALIDDERKSFMNLVEGSFEVASFDQNLLWSWIKDLVQFMVDYGWSAQWFCAECDRTCSRSNERTIRLGQFQAPATGHAARS